MQIPLAQPSFDERELAAVRRVLESGWVVQGPEVEAFEAALAEVQEAEYCIAVSSGTAALHICYLALGIGQGDAVFVPSFAWPSAANMAVAAGARPVFVDVQLDTYNIDPGDLRVRIEECIESGWGTPRAVVPVHEFGLPASMEEILTIARDHDMEVVEDAACALGASCGAQPVGTLGRMGTFSFHPRKSITTGEGGAIVTNDGDLARRCRSWRNHGQSETARGRDFEFPGMNYRMTEIQAAIGNVQLDKLAMILERRLARVEHYLEELSGLSWCSLPPASSNHTWQTFMIVLDASRNRDTIVSGLSAMGIGSGPGSVAGHMAQYVRNQYDYRPETLLVSRQLHEQGLALPLFDQMTAIQGAKVIDALSSLR